MRTRTQNQFALLGLETGLFLGLISESLLTPCAALCSLPLKYTRLLNNQRRQYKKAAYKKKFRQIMELPL